MKVAILSGKGGTGKTTLSVNLFSVLDKATLIDTDTEEPNSHIFLKGTVVEEKSVMKEYPVVDAKKCTLCGACGTHCNFNAIVPGQNKVIVFEDLCHDCGMCKIVCDSGAITYQEKATGQAFKVQTSPTKHYQYGKLNVGEISGVRIIEAVKKASMNEEMLIIDCPPGVSCSTVSALKGVDYAIVCAEPTPFGISDMKMVVELLRDMNIEFSVVINKSGLGDSKIYSYLNEEKIDLLAEIPFTKERAVIYSKGLLITEHDEVFASIMKNISEKVLDFAESIGGKHA